MPFAPILKIGPKLKNFGNIRLKTENDIIDDEHWTNTEQKLK